MENIPLKIPVKPHVKAWLEYHFPDYELSRNDFLGITLYHILKKQSKGYNKNTVLNPVLYSDKWEISISENVFFNYSCRELSTESIIHFNNLIDLLMDFFFITSVKNMLQPPPKTKKGAILQYMDDHGLTEDVITEDAYLKAYWRFKRKAKDVRLVHFN